MVDETGGTGTAGTGGDGGAAPEPPKPRTATRSTAPGARLWRAVRATARGTGRLVRSNVALLTTFVVGVLVGVLLSTLAANGWPFVREPEGDLQGDVLVLISGADDSPGGERERLIRTWNNLHPDMPAEIRAGSAVADEARSAMVDAAQSSARDADVYNLDVVEVAQFAESGWIRPLEDVDTTGFLEKPLATCRYEGELWALPFNTDAGLLYYRYRQLVALGIDEEVAHLATNPPREFGTVLQIIAKAFTAKRPADDRLEAGYTAQLGDYEGLTVNAMEAIWAAGGEVVDEGGTVRVDSEEAKSALRELGRAYRSARDVLPGTGSFQEAQSRDAFARGAVLFMRNWPLAYRQLTAPGDETGASAAPALTDVSVTSLPGPSALGGQNLAVASESRHPEAAQQLVEFLTSEASQQILFQDGGYAATRQRIYEDPYIRRNYGYAKLLLAAVQDAELRPVTPHYATFSEKFHRIVKRVLRSGNDVTRNDVRELQDALDGKVTPE